MAALVSGNMASATQPRNSATRARLGPIGGRTSGRRAARSRQPRQHRLHPPERRRQQPGQPRSARPSRARRAVAAAARARAPALTRPDRETGGAGSAAGAGSAFSPAGADFWRAILNGSIIWPYWTPDGQADSQARQSRQSSRCSRTPRPHRQPAVGDGPHQVDPAARAVVLVAGLDVGRAARGAKTAVDAFLVAAIGDLPGEPVEVDRRFAQGW